MKYAIVDLGSNTIRLSVYHTLEDGGFELLFSAKEMAGLVNYMNRGILPPEGVDKACDVLQGFQTLLKQFSMDEMHVFATAPLRNIRNTEEAVQRIRGKTGILVDVLSGEMEARLGYFGALLNCDLKNGAMFDIGGGSTEILQVCNGEIRQAESLPIGSLNLFNQHVSKIWPKSREIEAIQGKIGETLATVELPDQQAACVCGVGGSARAVLKIANAYYGRDSRVLTPWELEEIADLLLQRNREARTLILRACPDRIHTILPGVLLMEALSSALCRETLFISKYGVREGYLCHKLLPHTT